VRGRMWSSSQASTRGVVEMGGRVEAGPSHFPKRPAPRNPARYAHPFLPGFFYRRMLGWALGVVGAVRLF